VVFWKGPSTAGWSDSQIEHCNAGSERIGQELEPLKESLIAQQMLKAYIFSQSNQVDLLAEMGVAQDALHLRRKDQLAVVMSIDKWT